MKTLNILRHCKSDWSYGLPDHDRPLNERGKNDIPQIANRLNELNFATQRCFYSTANRAKTTAIGVCGLLHNKTELEACKALYTFSDHDFVDFVSCIDNQLDNVLIVAHNPGLTDLINYLTNTRLDNLPTGGFAQLKLEINSWKNIDYQCGTLGLFEFPKKF
ncbi:MAG: histidine phosphatase family protein [Flavobacteriales bacterium]|nr:histidine phosphatase family protein [Flavobacteriales bacterium]